MLKPVKIKVEYESMPIRHLAIQCPECTNWFMGHDICENNITLNYDLYGAYCACPKCDERFQIDIQNAEVDDSASFPEFYKQCLRKKETWETWE